MYIIPIHMPVGGDLLNGISWYNAIIAHVVYHWIKIRFQTLNLAQEKSPRSSGGNVENPNQGKMASYILCNHTPLAICCFWPTTKL